MLNHGIRENRLRNRNDTAFQLCYDLFGNEVLKRFDETTVHAGASSNVGDESLADPKVEREVRCCLVAYAIKQKEAYQTTGHDFIIKER